MRRSSPDGWACVRVRRSHAAAMDHAGAHFGWGYTASGQGIRQGMCVGISVRRRVCAPTCLCAYLSGGGMVHEGTTGAGGMPYCAKPQSSSARISLIRTCQEGSFSTTPTIMWP